MLASDCYYAAAAINLSSMEDPLAEIEHDVQPGSRSGQWWRVPLEKLQVTRLTAAHTIEQAPGQSPAQAAMGVGMSLLPLVRFSWASMAGYVSYGVPHVSRQIVWMVDGC
ncbi:hypothetical protein OsJ_27222 [Oryza sativa Japonica Group]|nr:hypothetical protein OsJ_27222 [Oryza sativa Japonica Group]